MSGTSKIQNIFIKKVGFLVSARQGYSGQNQIPELQLTSCFWFKMNIINIIFKHNLFT